ncbi:CoA transferase [Streptomyces sp. NPDC058755]|uniref:CoA transferase n=1 Tax=Streptomyces sp. NPDC058755 TaxID=3346624 RepID=UPI00369D74F4
MRRRSGRLRNGRPRGPRRRTAHPATGTRTPLRAHGRAVAGAGRERLCADGHSTGPSPSFRSAAPLAGVLDKTFATRSPAEWRELLDSAGLTYGVVQTLDEFAHDPQLVANRILVPIEDGSAEPHLTIDSPVRLDHERKVPARPAPDLVEHTESVLRDLGYDDARVAELRKAEAIE